MSSFDRDARDELSWRVLNAYPIRSVTVENADADNEHHVFVDHKSTDHDAWITALGEDSFADLLEER